MQPWDGTLVNSVARNFQKRVCPQGLVWQKMWDPRNVKTSHSIKKLNQAILAVYVAVAFGKTASTANEVHSLES
jgi:hypothetical protein